MRANLRLLSILLSLAFIVCGLAAATSGAQTVWLCKPGLNPDPCNPGLSTTVYSAAGTALKVVHPRRVRHPAADCFYVYPTVSDQTTPNANFNIDPEERSIALYQAARYSQYCRVFAPVYRQVTLAGIGLGASSGTPDPALALADVRSAFQDYLQNYNHGRPFVLIGHSQGSFVLRSLIKDDVDSVPAVRSRLLSAILLGGNVLVKTGSDIGGDFQHIPACHSEWQVGCVVAFSTFDTPVLANSKFGISSVAGESVLCTNPGDLADSSQPAPVRVITPSAPFAPGTLIAVGITILGLTQPMPPTVWVSEPRAYTAACSSANNANVLQITPVNGAQTPHPSPDATWGLHLLDAQIALGNLVHLVKTETGAYVRHQRRGRWGGGDWHQAAGD
jgi:Protein of unknown function (DUF3089)